MSYFIREETKYIHFVVKGNFFLDFELPGQNIVALMHSNYLLLILK